MAKRLRHTFFKTPLFKRYAAKLDAWSDIDRLKEDLDINPTLGDVIPGGEGLRKVRIPLASHGKGSRGGARVIYYLIVEQTALLLVDIFAKNEKESLSKEELDLLVHLKDDSAAQIRSKRHAK